MKKRKKKWINSEEYIVGLGVLYEPIYYIIGSFESEDDANTYKNYIENLMQLNNKENIDVFVERLKIYPLRKRIKRRR